MSSTRQSVNLIIGCLLVVAVLGYYVYLMAGANPKTASQAPPPAKLTLDEPSLLELEQKQVNGELPLTLNATDLGNPQPIR